MPDFRNSFTACEVCEGMLTQINVFEQCEAEKVKKENDWKERSFWWRARPEVSILSPASSFSPLDQKKKEKKFSVRKRGAKRVHVPSGVLTNTFWLCCIPQSRFPALQWLASVQVKALLAWINCLIKHPITQDVDTTIDRRHKRFTQDLWKRRCKPLLRWIGKQ